MRTTLLACVLSLCLVAPGLAGPYKDSEAAFKRGDYAMLLHRVAEQKASGIPSLDDPNTQDRLGRMYLLGRGVPQDYEKCAAWWRKAAEQGLSSAQRGLGTLYILGNGVPQDYVQAYKWLNLSAAQGDEEAVKSRNMVSHKMTSAQIAEAQRLAQEWKPKK